MYFGAQAVAAAARASANARAVTEEMRVIMASACDPIWRQNTAFQPVIMNFFAGDEICRGEAARAPRLFLALSADLRAPLSLHRCILAAKNRTTMPPR